MVRKGDDSGVAAETLDHSLVLMHGDQGAFLKGIK